MPREVVKRAGPKNPKNSGHPIRRFRILVRPMFSEDTPERVTLSQRDTHVRLQDVLDLLVRSQPAANVDLVKQAYVFSAKVHHKQVRLSGEPYLFHPLNVAWLIARMSLDDISVITALLHDTLEDSLTQPEELERLFGPVVRFLVEGVTKLARVSFHSGGERQAENVRKMLVAMAHDLRVIFVKLADRLHNMRTLDALEPARREAISQETLDIYAPLANRLGIQWIRSELEDWAFHWLHPRQFDEVAEKLSDFCVEREKYMADVVGILKQMLSENGIPAEVSGRIKHPYSIYRKMQLKHVDFDQIYDIIAFRIVPTTLDDCYRVLGLLHAMWKPVVGRFKDYIAMPKINRYQSLHTTVLGPGGERLEIQIRTREMHRVAELGVAAHWAYKEGKTDQRPALSQFTWLRELIEQYKDVRDPAEFLENVKVDLFSDEVFVFTPQGDVKALPFGATALDFAYLVHTQVGHHCVGAKVNGKIAPLRQKLKNGDTVEILTRPDQKPSKDWLAFVKTTSARNKIRSVIRAEERKRSEEIGRELLEKESKRRGINLQRAWKAGGVGEAARNLGYKDAEELLIALGYGRVQVSRVLERLAPEPKKEAPRELASEIKIDLPEEAFRKPGKKSKSGILVQGLDDVMVHFAKCCSPILGDELIGVVTRGRGVTVHVRTCRRVADADPERRIDVRWDMESAVARSVALRVVCDDRQGLLANVSNVLSDAGVNITQVAAKVIDVGTAVVNLKIAVESLEQLQKMIQKLERVKGVNRVERVHG